MIRRRNWKVPDLYVGNSSSIYWYTCGLNWRAFLAWTLGIWPSFRKLTLPLPVQFPLTNSFPAGFVVAISGIDLSPGWLKCFQAAWFIGFLGGGLVYFVVCLISPPPGRPYVRELFGNEYVEGVETDGSGEAMPSDVEKRGLESNFKAL